MAAFDERENLVTPYLLVIAVLRRRREREARRKGIFWIRENEKNAKSLYTSLDPFHEQGLVIDKLYCYGGHVGCEAVLRSG